MPFSDLPPSVDRAPIPRRPCGVDRLSRRACMGRLSGWHGGQ